MARAARAKATPKAAVSDEPFINLAQLLSKKPEFKKFAFWIVGDTPLITHSWSEKARRQLLANQGRATKAGKEARDPAADFVNSLYLLNGDTRVEQNDERLFVASGGTFGFPTTGVKKCVLSAAHKDKGIPRTDVRQSLWLDADIVRVRPALAGAVCDMPLTQVYGTPAVMREDMVRVGTGLSKKATLAYRAQFTTWAMRITGRLNPLVITPESLGFLVNSAGIATGIGEWRNEKDGLFGAFHLGEADEANDWEAFAAGNGPMPGSNVVDLRARRKQATAARRKVA